MNEDINVSTISVGDGADTETMFAMADKGGGVHYPVTNPSVLPRVFVRAVRIVRAAPRSTGAVHRDSPPHRLFPATELRPSAAAAAAAAAAWAHPRPPRNISLLILLFGASDLRLRGPDFPR